MTPTVLLATLCLAADPELVSHDLNTFVGYPTVAGERSFSAGAMWCNLGDANAAWESGTNQHPITVLNLYRVEGGALVQLGASWATHQICALQLSGCATCTPAGSGCAPALGVGCSTSSTGSALGLQVNMSKRSDADAATGAFLFPFSNPPVVTTLDRRCRAAIAEIDPASHASATFFFELEVLHPSAGDANARCVTRALSTASMLGTPLPNGAAHEATPAIDLWAQLVPDVTRSTIDLPDDGRVLVGSRAAALPDGTWRYDYAIQNLDSSDAVRSLSVPLGSGVDAASPAFRAPLAHSGEITSNDPWTVEADAVHIAWSTPPAAVNPNGNAVRWGTTYSYSFVSHRPPLAGSAALGLFHSDATVAVSAVVPSPLPTGPLGDLDGDGSVGAADLSILLGQWGACPVSCPADLDGSGAVDSADLAMVLGAWTN